MVPYVASVPMRNAARVAFAAALVVISVLLLLPGEDLPETGVWDKLEHAGAFAGLCLLGVWAFPRMRRWWLLPAALIAFGSVCEILQMWVPGRSASLADALADGVGAFAGYACAATLGHIWGRWGSGGRL